MHPILPNYADSDAPWNSLQIISHDHQIWFGGSRDIVDLIKKFALLG
jgi:hypothetical protein